MDKNIAKISTESIEPLIFLLRGQRVMWSHHLAKLYGVETRVLVQAVRRNIDRFPEDFMFQLTNEEFANLKSQIVISSWGGRRRAKPYAFTEQGVAMLSSVLRSKRAVQTNIEIMRAFTRLRQMLSTYDDLKKKIETMEEKYDENFRIVFEAIKQLIETEGKKKKRRIGYTVKENMSKVLRPADILKRIDGYQKQSHSMIINYAEA